jgi:tetratricopeptide (TPR) repeat protein
MRGVLAILCVLTLAACQTRSDVATSEYRSGLASYRAGLYERAISFFTSAIERGSFSNERQALVYNNRCDAYLQIGSYQESADDCAQAIELDNKLLSSYERMCWAKANLGQLESGLADCNSAVEKQPDDTGVAQTRARVYEKMGDKNKAIEEYRRALTLDPTYSEAESALKRLGAL